MKKVILVASALLMCSCGATNIKSQLDAGKGGIPVHQFSDAKTIKEIRNLKPQATLPLNIAVMPPQGWRSELSIEEREIIEGWSVKLKKIGFIESLKIIPESLKPNCGFKSDPDCYLEKSRAAGARIGADAILFLNHSTVTDSYVNVASVLNLTIIGMWIVPAHHRESYSVYESALFDIDNGYLYSTEEAHGEYKTVKPAMYVDHDTGQLEARLEALNKLGQKLYDMASKELSR